MPGAGGRSRRPVDQQPHDADELLDGPAARPADEGAAVRQPRRLLLAEQEDFGIDRGAGPDALLHQRAGASSRRTRAPPCPTRSSRSSGTSIPPRPPSGCRGSSRASRRGSRSSGPRASATPSWRDGRRRRRKTPSSTSTTPATPRSAGCRPPSRTPTVRASRDPRTGEILQANIGFYHNITTLVQAWYWTQAGAVDPRAQRLPFPDSLMGSCWPTSRPTKSATASACRTTCWLERVSRSTRCAARRSRRARHLARRSWTTRATTTSRSRATACT